MKQARQSPAKYDVRGFPPLIGKWNGRLPKRKPNKLDRWKLVKRVDGPGSKGRTEKSIKQSSLGAGAEDQQESRNVLTLVKRLKAGLSETKKKRNNALKASRRRGDIM